MVGFFAWRAYRKSVYPTAQTMLPLVIDPTTGLPVVTSAPSRSFVTGVQASLRKALVAAKGAGRPPDASGAPLPAYTPPVAPAVGEREFAPGAFIRADGTIYAKGPTSQARSGRGAF